MKNDRQKGSIRFLKLYGLMTTFIIYMSALNAQLAYWAPEGQSGFGVSPFPPASSDPNLTVTGLVRGSGVTTSGSAAADAWGGNGWDGAANDDITWTMTANAGYQQSLSSFNLRYRRSGTGPASGILQYAIGSGSYMTVANLTFSSTSSSGANHAPVSLSAVADLQNVPAGTVIRFRLAPSAGTGSTGTFYVQKGGGLSISGTVSPLSVSCDEPENTNVADITYESAVLSWDASAGNTFEYVLDENSTAPSVSGTATSDLSYAASGLTPATTYYFHVRTDCGSGNYSDWETVTFTTEPLPCAVPGNVSVSDVTYESAVLSWDASTGNTFEYVLDENSTAPSVSGTATSDLSYAASGLTPATTYYFHVRTDCGSGNYSDWETVTFTTEPLPCVVPGNVSVSDVTYESADLSWEASAGNTFEYVLDENSTAPSVSGTATSDLSYTASGLAPATTYYFHVRTDCGSGNYSDWETVTFTTEPLPCVVPGNVSVSDVTYESAVLSWEASAGNTFEYVLDENSTAPSVSGTATSDLSYNASGLTPATTYYFHVRTDCGSGNYSDWETVTFTTEPLPCVVPGNVSVSDVTYESAVLSWDASTGNTFEYVLDENSTAPSVSGTATSDISYTASGLTPTTTYYFHVRTDCGSGNYSDWETVTFTTEPLPCAVPGNVSVSDVTYESAVLSWDASTGNTFEYVLDENSTAPSVSGTATSDLSYNASGLSPATTYYFHVRTDCGSGNYSDWETVSFTTLTTVGLDLVQGETWSVYPNPAVNHVTIDASVKHGTATLVSIKGQRLKTIDLSQATTLDLSDVGKGIYFLVHELYDRSSSVKLIVE